MYITLHEQAPPSPLQQDKIKDNGVDKVNGGIVVYITLHEIPPFALDMPLDLILKDMTLVVYIRRRHNPILFHAFHKSGRLVISNLQATLNI